MRVWITKYALTEGIQFHDNAEVVDRGMIRIPRHGDSVDQYFHGLEWHPDEVSAVERAEEMRLSKIASLQKQIVQLEKLSFQKANPND